MDFMDSSGLAALVQGMKKCRDRGGDLRLCQLQQPVRMILELTRLDKALDIFPSEGDAIASFAG
ncbi:MAG: STAS domain-containing protein [Caldilineaceae bacterium]